MFFRSGEENRRDHIVRAAAGKGMVVPRTPARSGSGRRAIGKACR